VPHDAHGRRRFYTFCERVALAVGFTGEDALSRLELSPIDHDPFPLRGPLLVPPADRGEGGRCEFPYSYVGHPSCVGRWVPRWAFVACGNPVCRFLESPWPSVVRI
jgi:hypothetical protein